MAADPMVLDRSCNYVRVGDCSYSPPTSVITTTSTGPSSTTIYFCGTCGKEKRSRWVGGCWPPVDYCDCEPPGGNDATVKPVEQLNASPWKCPGCGVHYGPSVDRCECAKYLTIPGVL